MSAAPGQPIAVWRDGDLRPPRWPDPGLLSGMGVFETLLVTAGTAFAPTRHLRRLQEGSARMDLPIPNPEAFRAAVGALSAQCQGVQFARLRLTWTPGPSGTGCLLGTVAPFTPMERVRAALSPYRRNEDSALTGVKSTSYAENLLALRQAQRLGADEAILPNSRGDLCEGATSNVFIEQGGELLTPPLSSGCLPGITRELALEWGREAGLPVRETDLPVSVMNTTQGAAVTSALKGVVALAAIDGRPLKLGPLTRELAAEFRRRRARTRDP